MKNKEKTKLQKEENMTGRFLKKLSLLSAVFFAATLMQGCALRADTPVSGWLFTQTKGPVAATSVKHDPRSPKKIGTGEAFAINPGIILGMSTPVAWGDASIATAKAKANIKTIHHVDNEVMCILGVFCQYKINVYGQ